MLGVDFASVDEIRNPDWTAVRAGGYSFAFLRASYKAWPDPTFSQQAQRARNAGLTIGAYMFPVMSVSAPSCEAQISAFVESVGAPAERDLPPVLDVEFPGGIHSTGRTREELLAWVYQAVGSLRSHFGQWPILYTSARVWDGSDTDSLHARPTPDLTQCPLWVARYLVSSGLPPITDETRIPHPPVPRSWGDDGAWIHQYQGDARGVPGLAGTVDLNHFLSLRENATGERVRWVQRILQQPTTGIFDASTAQCVRDFQRAHNLAVDGVVGVATFARLCKLS